jgi:hypothetical protein
LDLGGDPRTLGGAEAIGELLPCEHLDLVRVHAYLLSTLFGRMRLLPESVATGQAGRSTALRPSPVRLPELLRLYG